MLAEDLKPDLFTHAHGLLFVGPTRIMALTMTNVINFMKETRKAMGDENLANMSFRVGYEIGMATALALTELYQFDSTAEALKAASVLGCLGGWARLDYRNMVVELDGESVYIRGTWRDSFEVESWRDVSDLKREAPVCRALLGHLSGYYTGVLGQEVLAEEIRCQAQGHEECVFEARTLKDWGLETTSIRQMFASEPLADQLARLQEELQQANDKLEAQKVEIEQLKETPNKSDGEIVFRCQSMAKLLELARKVAPMKTTVLIQGESGTGKEVFARLIHHASEAKGKPFLAINCAALPPNLLESELFGHVKGAFTGADKDKRGLFQEAEGGTLFLDEIGELPMEIQAKLLRVLQEYEIRPIGGLKNIPVQVRLIATTNRDLKKMIETGAFRMDLYFRLSVFPMQIPPLRERRQDILLLARHFLRRIHKEHPGFSPQAIHHLESYSWPGNVRELENWIEYAVILSGDSRILPEHFPQIREQQEGADVKSLILDFPSLEELQQRYVSLVLERTEKNKKEAARILKIGKSTLWRYSKSI